MREHAAGWTAPTFVGTSIEGSRSPYSERVAPDELARWKAVLLAAKHERESEVPIVANAQREVIGGVVVYNFAAPVPERERASTQGTNG